MYFGFCFVPATIHTSAITWWIRRRRTSVSRLWTTKCSWPWDTSFNGNLRPTDKAALSHILTDSFIHPELPSVFTNTSIVIDGMALVQAIGKPTTAKTFGDLANIFCKSIFKHFSGPCKRIYVIFDTYRQKTIKAITRRRRTSKNRKFNAKYILGQFKYQHPGVILLDYLKTKLI